MTTNVNFKAAYDSMQAALRATPAAGAVSFGSESRQTGGVCSTARIRQFDLTVDEPPTLGGTDRGPNPVELVLAALGTCQEITYRLYADAMGIPLNGVSVRVDGNLDICGFFGADDRVRPGYQDIRAVVTLDSPAPEADLQRLKDAVDRHCPVLDIIRNATPVALELKREGAGARAAE